MINNTIFYLIYKKKNTEFYRPVLVWTSLKYQNTQIFAILLDYKKWRKVKWILLKIKKNNPDGCLFYA